MRFPQQFVQTQQLPSGTLSLSGTAPQTVVGESLDSGLVGTDLCAIVTAQASTTSITLTARWQVYVNSAWINAQDGNNGAPTALVTGSGVYGSPNVVTVALSAPSAVKAGSHLCRVVVSSASATASSATEQATIAYEFRAPTNTLGS